MVSEWKWVPASFPLVVTKGAVGLRAKKAIAPDHLAKSQRS